ncbi:MAG: aldehyde dehydrogenase family protein [Candidatus Curtissbacteria bacterium]|nr:aldehyde dehydrogenase family protein [Candidatus Curtissbacteria bacterium]
MVYPKKIFHFVGNKEITSASERFFSKINPDSGRVIADVARGNGQDVDKAITVASKALDGWRKISVVERSLILRNATVIMGQRRKEIAQIVSVETGKSLKDALGEVLAAVELGFFISGEGRRFYGRTTTSAVLNRFAMTVRSPIGVCALIVAANTPIANVAWKAYPALLCGNAAVMKPSEDTPYTAIWFARVLKEAGLPLGIFNVILGFGEEAGVALVEDSRVDLVSFTGSVPVGKYIQSTAGERLAKVCLELGGKNPFVVCDDADLDAACDAAVLSAFSNAGQRCASGSRIIVFDNVYEKFKKMLVVKTKNLKLGNSDSDDLGPVINSGQLEQMLLAVEKARSEGVRVLCGGLRLVDSSHKNGYYMVPTIIENANERASISQDELFGPITILFRVKDFAEALKLANNSVYGLTAAIHTKSIDRAEVFRSEIQAGVISINGPTHGSEPHMPFGGFKNSGNGFREPGTEALDVYSEWKTVYIKHDPENI